jgi:di/tricarboxylate transporter
MSWEAVATLLVIAATIAAMIRDIVPPTIAVVGGTIVLLIIGVIDAQQALSGFSNPAPFTIAALYVVAGAATRTGAIQPVLYRALHSDRSDRAVLGRLLPPVAFASAFTNNTPIIAVLVPEISAWADRHGRSVSRFLMPLSFAAILGGIVTLIGTATNIVVSGLIVEAGGEPLGFFEITVVGLPIALLGVGFVIWMAPIRLEDRPSTREELTEHAREFVVDMSVTGDGPLDSVTVEAAGLRHLRGVYLFQIEREGETISPVEPTTVLRGDDFLRFAGKADDIVDLMAIRGLTSSSHDQFDVFDLSRASFFEAVIGANSSFIGETLRSSNFRRRQQAVVVAIHRSGQRIDAKLGDVVLRVGDTLVILADPDFRGRWRDRREFLLISPLAPAPPVIDNKRWLVAGIAAVMVVLAATGVMPIFQASLLAAFAVIAFRTISPGEARNAIQLDVVLLIAGGFGLAEAMASSGLAELIGDGLVDTLGTLGPLGAFAGVVIATMLLTEAVSNTAAAVIMFPIAIAAAAASGADPRGYAIAVAVAASASFLTPIGYQTNTMVYGPGGYRYTEYARLGAPLAGLVLLGLLLIVPQVWSI